ncbi:MAG: hypothetical protein S4CHLAM37_12150 [Chlamydiia bacterium]|nr:hypothetical protein [Chlamydiia bacterium]
MNSNLWTIHKKKAIENPLKTAKKIHKQVKS